MAISKEIADALAKAYPQHAAHAVAAVALNVETQTRKVPGGSAVVGRFRKYRMPNGQVVPLDEPEPTVEDALRAENAALKAQLAEQPPKAPVEDPAKETKAADLGRGHGHSQKPRTQE